MSIVKAHCNDCGGERNHELLHSAQTDWEDEEAQVWTRDIYETIRCCGCELIKFRRRYMFSEDYEETVTYFPPAISRPPPAWFTSLQDELDDDDLFVQKLLHEVYVAVQNDLPRLATMGVRALLERIMVSRADDQGSFAKNLAKFEELGHVSSLQRQRLDAILEAGHAVMHRAYKPQTHDVITLLDITEHIVESVFLHEAKVEALKKRIPTRGKPPAA